MVAIFNILWVPAVAFLDIAVPDRILTVPIIASFVVSMAHFVTLYRLRVRMGKGQLLGSVCAAMSVQWTVARAVSFGLIKDHLPFVRTSKGGLRRSTDFHAFWEAIFAGLLNLGALVLIITNAKEIREIYIFADVLMIQSLPFLAAVGLAVFERTRLNEFATWRTIETRLAERLPKRFLRSPRQRCLRRPYRTHRIGAVTASAAHKKKGRLAAAIPKLCQLVFAMSVTRLIFCRRFLCTMLIFSHVFSAQAESTIGVRADVLASRRSHGRNRNKRQSRQSGQNKRGSIRLCCPLTGRVL